MIKPFLPLIMLLLVISSCSTSKRTAGSSAQNTKPALTSVPKSTNEGLSFATAIVITEKTETTGVQAEYNWIKDHYVDYTVKKQSLSYHDKKPFDIITIALANGKELALYFDISNYFGKF